MLDLRTRCSRGHEEISYAGCRFAPEVIRQAIWLYLRFTLSFRDVEDLLAERRIAVSYEIVRRWVNHIAPMIAAHLRKRSPTACDLASRRSLSENDGNGRRVGPPGPPARQPGRIRPGALHGGGSARDRRRAGYSARDRFLRREASLLRDRRERSTAFFPPAHSSSMLVNYAGTAQTVLPVGRREPCRARRSANQRISSSPHAAAPPPSSCRLASVALRLCAQRRFCEITRDVANVTTPITGAASPAMRRASVYPGLGRRGGEVWRRRAVSPTGRETPHRRCGFSAGDEHRERGGKSATLRRNSRVNATRQSSSLWAVMPGGMGPPALVPEEVGGGGAKAFLAGETAVGVGALIGFAIRGQQDRSGLVIDWR